MKSQRAEVIGKLSGGHRHSRDEGHSSTITSAFAGDARPNNVSLLRESMNRRSGYPQTSRPSFITSRVPIAASVLLALLIGGCGGEQRKAEVSSIDVLGALVDSLRSNTTPPICQRNVPVPRPTRQGIAVVTWTACWGNADHGSYYYFTDMKGHTRVVTRVYQVDSTRLRSFADSIRSALTQSFGPSATCPPEEPSTRDSTARHDPAHFRWDAPDFGVQLIATSYANNPRVMVQYEAGEAFCRGWVSQPLVAL